MYMLWGWGWEEIKCVACRTFYCFFALSYAGARMLDSIYHMMLKLFSTFV